ncbi:MAG TPA: ribonuclease P protein component [Candidatus Paceibacterota bacterium]
MPKKHRLSHAEFSSRAGGRRVHGALFALSIAPLPAGPTKVSCVVSKKTALKAHDRNLLKRRCREVLRPHIKTLKHPYALVLQAKKQARGASFSEIREDVENLVQSLE